MSSLQQEHPNPVTPVWYHRKHILDRQPYATRCTTPAPAWLAEATTKTETHMMAASDDTTKRLASITH
jgi:hypothetical protein